MVVVRLAKSGAKKNPYYFITVADSRKPRDGAFIERLGFFNPSAKGSEERMRFNVDRLDHWISQGAQLSDKVKELAKDARLSPDDLQAKLDAKKDRRVQKKEAIKAQKIAELEAKAKEAAEEEAAAEEAPAEEEPVAEEAAPAEEEAPAEEAPAEEAPAEEEPVAEEAAPAEEEAPAEESEEEPSDDEKK
jgi:small subunit ribosomal protein S16